MAKNRVILEVVEIPGRCPIYSLGDQIVIDPHPDEEVSMINLEETDAICTRVLGGALLSYHAWFERAQSRPTDAQLNPWQRALGPDYSKCPMVGPPYSTCGYVLFKVYGNPEGKEV